VGLYSRGPRPAGSRSQRGRPGASRRPVGRGTRAAGRPRRRPARRATATTCLCSAPLPPSAFITLAKVGGRWLRRQPLYLIYSRNKGAEVRCSRTKTPNFDMLRRWRWHLLIFSCASCAADMIIRALLIVAEENRYGHSVCGLCVNYFSSSFWCCLQRASLFLITNEKKMQHG
jgi:hypothetical protein